MPKHNNETEISKFLQEHITYERIMLGHTYIKIHSAICQLDWNAYYESFCVHARNLYDFLRNEGSNNTFFAGKYVSGWQKPQHDDRFNKLDSFIFHMSQNRLEKQKPNTENLQFIGKWIDKHWQIWHAKLNDPYKALISSDPVCVDVPAILTSTFSTSNHVTSSSTSSHSVVSVVNSTFILNKDSRDS